MSSVEQEIEQWLEWTPSSSADHLRVLTLRDDPHLRAEFALSRLVFGTAGIRGPMGLGLGKMNDLVIVQTTQGLAHHLLRRHAHTPFERLRVLVGHDGRHKSAEWSKLVSSVLRYMGIEVSRFRSITPTPWVAFGVRHLQMAAGVMITASHNPKEDNGYKVYDEKGVQILPHMAEDIEKSILDNLKPCSMQVFSIEHNDLVESRDTRDKHLVEHITHSYIDQLKGNVFDLDMNKKCKLKFVYSAMHGVGGHFLDEVFEALQLPPLLHVQQQREADPDFPTVAFPNPEEGASALKLAFVLAEEQEAQYVLANDPDADRLAVAQRIQGEWKVFTGNEIGALLGWWMLHVAETREKAWCKQYFFLASTVSSKLLASVARSRSNVHFEETLTGFKWMGSRAHEIEKASKDNVVLLAFEEAIGFMCKSNVLDKDGVSAAVHVAELAIFLDLQSKTLNDQLIHLYNTYGYHFSLGRYLRVEPGPELEAMFGRIRNYCGKKNNYPNEFVVREVEETGKEFERRMLVSSVRDLTLGTDSAEVDNKCRLLATPSSHMITFRMDNGVVVSVRNSGTEPKLKFYAEYCAQPQQTEWKKLEHELQLLLQSIMDMVTKGKNGN